MDPRSEVVITGLGLVSPIGVGVDAVWESLLESRGGIRRVDWLADAQHPVTVGAEITGFEAKQYVKPRKAMKVMSHEIQLGFGAAVLAKEHAALPEELDVDRLGVVFGCDMLYSPPTEMAPVYRVCCQGGDFDFSQWGAASSKQLNPLWMLLYLPNMPACHIGISCDARGHNNTMTMGEVSGLLAVIEATAVVQRGCTDVMITGGVGNRLDITTIVFRGTGELSAQQDSKALKPFDEDRDGTVHGEGAAAMIIESRTHAENRKATILASIAGHHCTHGQRDEEWGANQEAIERSIRGALKTAGLQPADIGFVIANGVGTQVNDAQEARAIASVLDQVPVTALKGFYGNTGAGSSALDLAIAVHALQKQQVPPTLNFSTPDSSCPINVVAHKPQAHQARYAMVLSQSGTGQAAAVIVRRD